MRTSLNCLHGPLPRGRGSVSCRQSRARQQVVERGGALLAVLWLSVALSVIAFSVAANVRGETERSGTATERLRAYYLASGSVDRAILWIYWGMYGGHVNADGSPRYYKPPMPYIRYSYPTGEVMVEVIPEAGKLNINTSNAEEMARLLFTTGIDAERAQHIARGIVGYRSAAAEGAVSTASSDSSTFRQRNASLEELEEMLLVPGMTPDLFFGRFDRDPSGRLIPRGGLRECFTVWGAGSTIDVNTAAPALLESFGLNPGAVAEIVRRRNIAPFRTMDEVRPLIEGGGPNASRLGISGATIWTLRSTARVRLPNGRLSEVRRTVAGVVKFLDPGQFNPPYHVLRWYDDAWSPGVIPF
jgi:general secretion pathway protein K